MAQKDYNIYKKSLYKFVYTDKADLEILTYGKSLSVRVLVKIIFISIKSNELYLFSAMCSWCNAEPGTASFHVSLVLY